MLWGVIQFQDSMCFECIMNVYLGIFVEMSLGLILQFSFVTLNFFLKREMSL